jgi:16S rRNA (guanine527-N7)-methyltransferase
MVNCQILLREGLSALSLPSDADKEAKLLDFIDLIAKWNQAYNLTAVRDKEAMVSLHLLDSLAILPYLHGQRWVDIGTGAGLPGIPLAIYQPDKEFVLIDSNAKKTRFVQQVILELGLKNVSVLHSRVENYRPVALFDTVLCRAFASMGEISKLTQHLLADDGLLLAMKGQVPAQELTQLSQNYRVIELIVPQIAAQRCVIYVKKAVILSSI